MHICGEKHKNTHTLMLWCMKATSWVTPRAPPSYLAVPRLCRITHWGWVHPRHFHVDYTAVGKRKWEVKKRTCAWVLSLDPLATSQQTPWTCDTFLFLTGCGTCTSLRITRDFVSLDRIKQLRVVITQTVRKSTKFNLPPHNKNPEDLPPPNLTLKLLLLPRHAH